MCVSNDSSQTVIPYQTIFYKSHNVMESVCGFYNSVMFINCDEVQVQVIVVIYFLKFFIVNLSLT